MADIPRLASNASRIPKLMFIAGEASGDAHAADLVKALRRKDAGLQTFGAGGPKMREAGTELLLDLTEHAVVGFVEVLRNYRKFKTIFDDLLAEVERRQPSAVVLVDFPGFNLRFARAVKQRVPRTKVIYYISPQLWAWHAGRAKQIERDVDLMLTIFPFEKDWYARRAPKLRVEFVGHPMIDRFASEPKATTREPNLLALLPGSRAREVEKIFPVLCKVVDRMPEVVEFAAAAVSEKTAALMQHPRVKVEVSGAHGLMRRAALAITASGTATMECAYFGCPMIVVYKVNWLTYLLGRAVVQVNWLAMPNVIAGREIVPEFLQQRARPYQIARTAQELLGDTAKRAAMQRDLAEVVKSLGGPGASERAASLIQGELSL
jgi:lipid-A-disaccharide synthase